MRKITFIILIFAICICNCKSDTYTWTNIGTNLPDNLSTQTLTAISIIGDSMWVCSGYGTYLNQTPGEVYFSTDRGKTFTIQSTLYGTHALKMLNSKVGYCGGVEGQIYKTTNSGIDWVRTFSFGRTLMSIDFPPNSDTGFCSGFTGGVKMITPTGLVTVDMNDYVSNISSVSCIDSRHAFVAGEEIIGPVVDGVLQINQSYPGTNGIYAISMIDTNYGWCVGSPTASGSYDSNGCMIIRTVDGQEWEEQINPVKGKYGTLMAVKAIDRNNAWAVGTSGVVIRTTDGGVNWIRQAEGLTNEMLLGIAIADNGEVYVVGNNRTLLRYAAVSDVKDELIDEIAVFPNPSGNCISISNYSGEIEIYDILGNSVLKTFIEKSSKIDISSINSGYYFIKCKDKYIHLIKGF